MGNRAVIVTEEGWKNPSQHIGVYLHWNGGRDSVEAFLEYCRLQHYRPPEENNYGWAALLGLLFLFFEGSGMSVGVDVIERLDCDNFDNGVYIIREWKIVRRAYFSACEQREYPLPEFLIQLDQLLPPKQQLTEKTIRNMYNKKDDEKICSDI